MFKFLKDKLKSAISKISEGVEKEGKAEERVVEKSLEEPKEEKGFFAKLKEKIVGKEEKTEVKKEKIKETAEEKKQVHLEHKKKEKIVSKPVNIETKKEVKKNDDKIFLEQINSKDKQLYNKTFQELGINDSDDVIRESIKFHDGGEFREKREKKFNKTFEKLKAQEEIKKEVSTVEPKKFSEVEPKKEVKPEPEKKGFFASLTEKIITTKINEAQFDNLFSDMELALMENNVAIEVIEKIKNDLKEELVEKPIRRTKVEETISAALKNSVSELFEKSDFDLVQEIKNKAEKPYVIAFFGINGSGKTTSIAKLANMLKERKISCVLAAADTFRAASIEQLQIHADKIGVKIIKHNYGADPAAVAFDAIKHAKAKSIDAVLIDTAGRMHSNANLIDEMKKIIRVAKPDLKIFVGESITGNDCVDQAKTFNEAVGIDGIILAKADIDEKGGAAVSVSYVTKKPILYLGMGQEYSDLQEFEPEVIVKGLGLA